MSEQRVGHGFDAHRLVPGRRLVLGGVEIPHERGLEGHSDADVLTHAVMDALLGAAGLPDIGCNFPPGDPKYKDADSMALLEQVKGLLEKKKVQKIINIDAVIVAEKPRLKEHIPEMRRRFSEVLAVDERRIGIKATTTEGMGFTGHEEGIAASAVCLISVDG